MKIIKLTLTLCLVLTMVFSLVACGKKADQKNDKSSEPEKAKVEEQKDSEKEDKKAESPKKGEYSKMVGARGYLHYAPKGYSYFVGQMGASKFNSTSKDKFVIEIGAPFRIVVNGFDDIIEKSQETLYKGYKYYRFHGLYENSGESNKQVVEKKEEVEINGIPMLRVEGHILSGTNEKVDFIAYYLYFEDDGKKYPSFVVATNFESSKEAMSKGIADFMSRIEVSPLGLTRMEKVD